MVVRLLTGKNIAGALLYNEQKVREGDAERLAAGNFPDPQIALTSWLAKREMLEFLASRNPRVEKPTVHLSLAFHPSEQLNNDLLRRISQEFLDAAGYGKQPYLLYQHHDTAHPHVHIVTVCVDRKGQKISDTFIRNRMNTIRQQLEKKFGLIEAEGVKPERQDRVGEGPAGSRRLGQQETKAAIEATLNRVTSRYSLASFEDLRRLLATYHIDARTIHRKVSGRTTTGVVFRLTDGIKPISVAIKASKLESRPTYDRLQGLFKAGQAGKIDQKPHLLNALRRQLSGYKAMTEADFYNVVRSAGVQVVETNGTYLYIDHSRGGVWHEAELGKAWQYEQLSRKFADTTVEVGVAISPETGKQLGQQVSRLFELYRQQTDKTESGLIEEFPFTELIQGLRGEGVPLEQAIQTVRQFEVYKQSQLPQIRAKELLSNQRTASEKPRHQDQPIKYEEQSERDTGSSQRLR